MNTEKDVWNNLKREDIIPFLDEYYKKLGREHTPNYQAYSLQELKKCLILFNICLVREEINPEKDG